MQGCEVAALASSGTRSAVYSLPRRKDGVIRKAVRAGMHCRAKRRTPHGADAQVQAHIEGDILLR